MIELRHWNSFVKQVMMPDQLQKLHVRTDSCKPMVVDKESTQAQYEEAPCELSDAHNEDFDLELQYMSVTSLNDALPN